jgi:hypothetical protein
MPGPFVDPCAVRERVAPRLTSALAAARSPSSHRVTAGRVGMTRAVALATTLLGAWLIGLVLVF